MHLSLEGLRCVYTNNRIRGNVEGKERQIEKIENKTKQKIKINNKYKPKDV